MVIVVIAICGMIFVFSSIFALLEIKNYKKQKNAIIEKLETICEKDNKCTTFQWETGIDIKTEYGKVHIKYDKNVKTIEYKIYVDIDLSDEDKIEIINITVKDLSDILKLADIQTIPENLTKHYELSEDFINEFKTLSKENDYVLDRYNVGDIEIRTSATYSKKYDAEYSEKVDYIYVRFDVSENTSQNKSIQQYK